MLDDLSYLPAVTALLILLAAWSIPMAPPTAPQPARLRGFAIPVVVLLVSAITLPAVLSMTGARLVAASGRQAAVAGEWGDARLAFEAAVRLHPADAQLWMSVGLSGARTGDADGAVDAYTRAREISPGDPRPWGALAALTHDRPATFRLLDEAARRSNDPRYAFRLGTALLQEGRQDAAARAFAIGTALLPDWFASIPRELWPGVREALPDAIRAVGSVGGHRPEEALWNSGLVGGELPPEADLPWQAVADAADGDVAAAWELFAEAKDREPQSARVDQAASAIALLGCDRDAYVAAEARLASRRPELQEGSHPVREGRAGVYREPELGDYQPLTGRSVPEPPPWPLGLIEVPDCGW
jgi:thioredoxin-like negative regulator of GroEL